MFLSGGTRIGRASGPPDQDHNEQKRKQQQRGEQQGHPDRPEMKRRRVEEEEEGEEVEEETQSTEDFKDVNCEELNHLTQKKKRRGSTEGNQEQSILEEEEEEQQKLDLDVGVFWDYENVRIPRWCRTADAANAIRSAVINYGRISERRLYFDSKKVSEQFTDRVNLDMSGFTLIDCPARGKKETLDKRMIVDILAFAWERAARRIPTCVVLITSDGDYAYTVAKLRDIGVRTVIIYGERTTTADVLLDACDNALSWIFDVLKRPTQEDVGDVETSKSEDLLSPTAAKTVKGSKEELPLPLRRETSLSDALEGRHLLFLNCLATVQTQQLSKLVSKYPDLERKSGSVAWQDCWAIDSQVVQQYNAKRGLPEGQSNASYKEMKRSAADAGFIVIGRKDATTGEMHVSSSHKFAPSEEKKLLSQQYIRLTAQGRDQLRGNDNDDTADEE